MPTATAKLPKNRLAAKNTRPFFILETRDASMFLGKDTRIMGIINVTPDSFSGDGLLKNSRQNLPEKILLKAKKLIAEGADILDIGGESSRPGAEKATAQEEIARVIPAIRLLAGQVKVPLSVDTYKEIVARHALDAGALIVNNIMGSKISRNFLKMIKRYNAAIVLMHIRGTPKTMQRRAHYQNLIAEIINELRNSLEKCFEIGVKSDKIIIDPGIGFGKTTEQNLEIIRRLEEFKILNQPILIGTSRKSFIGKVLNHEAGDRLFGTAATLSASILKGAHILRVHDVKEAKDVAQMTDAILNPV